MNRIYILWKNGSFYGNNGFSVVNPVLNLKPTLSTMSDKLFFLLTECVVLKEDSHL